MKPLPHLDPEIDAALYASMPIHIRAYLLLVTHARLALLVFIAGMVAGTIIGLVWAGGVIQ